jgi:predicted ester cyclase
MSYFGDSCFAGGSGRERQPDGGGRRGGRRQAHRRLLDELERRERVLFEKDRGEIAVIKTDLSEIYRDYIACLNKQDWQKLEHFVHDAVCYNGQQIGLLGYREMLERDFHEIPDLYFNIHLLISDPPYVASRLGFDCTPKGKFLGLHVDGKRVSFAENVFYEFRGERIERVWSVIDKAAIEAQL